MSEKFTASLGGQEVSDTEGYIPLYGPDFKVIGKARAKGGMLYVECDGPFYNMFVTDDIDIKGLSIVYEPVKPKEGEKMNDPFRGPLGSTDEPILPKDNPLSELDIAHRFGFHKASIEGPNASAEIHKILRLEFVAFASKLNALLSKSREASLTMTALEEASMWSHKAIAKTDPIDPEV